MSEVSLRPARREDCASIARLYRMAADGVADYIWSTLAEPGEDLLEVGRRRYEREGTAFSYQNCTVADAGGAVVGLLMAFPMLRDPAAPAAQEVDPVLAPYAGLEEDRSYYVAGVSAAPEWRGRGIGSRLLALAEEQARGLELDCLSLVCFEENAAAKRLYDRLGYRVVARAAVVPHPLIGHTGDALLLVKRLH